MSVINGRVLAAPRNRGVPGLIVSAFAMARGTEPTPERRRRLGAVPTGPDGSFAIEHPMGERESSGRDDSWDLLVTVEVTRHLVDGAERTLLASETREDASPHEAFRFVIADARLASAGIVLRSEPGPDERIAIRRTAREEQTRFDADTRRQFTDSLRRDQERRATHADGFHRFLRRLAGAPGEGRQTASSAYLAPGADVVEENLRVMKRTLQRDLPHARATGAAVLDDSFVEGLRARFGPELDRVPAEAIEKVAWPWKRGRPARLTSRLPLRRLCGGPPPDDCVRRLEGEPAAQPPPHGNGATNGSSGTAGDGATANGSVPDVAALVHAQTDHATSPETVVSITPRPGVNDVQGNVDSFLLRSGPADTPALFDFHHLRIAFESVWQEVFDDDATHKAQELYSELVELGLDPNEYLFGPNDEFWLALAKTSAENACSTSAPLLDHPVTTAFSITQDEWCALTPNEQGHLHAKACEIVDENFEQSILDKVENQISFFFDQDERELTAMVYQQALRRARKEGERLIANARARLEKPQSFDRLHSLLGDLEAALKKPYRFNVYAANRFATSVNFGVVTTYRQRWTPVGYQVGELVKTIPLAPKEVRRFTRKTVIRRSRAEKEVTNSIQSRKTESSDTWRAESEIVAKAMTKTNFQLGAQGGVNVGIGHVSGSTSLSHDTAAESQEVKKEFREAVFKAAEEYKLERTLQIDSSESIETTGEESGEISNPNDEIPVTYLFYQLQRRFRVSEEIRSAMPVVLVAQHVPNRIDEAWLVQHDWVLRRTLLDDSFAPALTYVSTKVVGDEVALGELYKNVEQVRALVNELKDELIAVHAQVGSRYKALETAIARHARAVEAEEEDDGIIPMPVGFLTDGANVSAEATRVREQAARDAYERAAKEEKELQARLDRETTALTAITESYTKQLSEHLNRKAQIARLLVHIRENIFYYMQAIWSYESPDQRFFRLHDVRVPRLVGTKTYKIEPDPDGVAMPPSWKVPHKLTVHSEIDAENLELDALGDVADLDNLLGYKGNFMIFPMREGNDLTDFQMTPYYDRFRQLMDPDPLGNWTLHDLAEYVCCLQKTLPEEQFERRLPALADVYRRMKERGADEEEIVVPSDSLYIEALPGTRPVLEDFKLLHRALDVKKVQAEVRAAELENVRMAARLFAGEREDPTIEKKIVVENGATTIVGSEP